MKAFCVLGASALREQDFVCDLIAGLRIDGWSVSNIKRAPDGFDLDQPGRGSYAKREAGCSEVMLVGDRRLVLMQEFRHAEPSIDSLLARLEPVDVVMLEGFRNAALPTVEVWLRASGRSPRWLENPHVFAVVSDGPVDRSIASFQPTDVAALATHIAKYLRLVPRSAAQSR
ncbi:MAG TPA: molybdopterin-guanine dinucleotide biosynthesis protein MobB [Casimicrobiaceae bacterium]|nr:molybdopterin-guanine dinucleotide biosynthesis protein MobB [Casimicrobiaceae bacterium]